jgi:cyclophilin family peptidyl-prolyl cis-trans isomerase
MKRLLVLNVFLIIISFSLSAQSTKSIKGQHVVIETSMGNMELVLYDDTPLHKENMIKLINEGFFEGQLFHRVINNFMIQGGDPNSVNAPKGQRLGTGGPGYQIAAEIRPNHIHKKGALSAARQGDNVNPEKKSSGSQFYVVKGQVITVDKLAQLQSQRGLKPFTPKQIEAYTTVGGTPHLDGAYTVFGEVVKGMEIIDAISAVETDNSDRPLNDVIYSIKLK